MSQRSADASAPYFLTVRQGPTGEAFWEVAWRHRADDGTTRQVKRRLGPAWVARDDAGEWVKRRGRTPSTHLDERGAHAAANRRVCEVDAQLRDDSAQSRRRRDAPVTFRIVATAYLAHMRDVKGSRPSTLRDYGNVLAEPGAPHRRGPGSSPGYVMAAIGDTAAAEVSTADVDAMLATVAKSGASASTVNKYRRIVSAIYGWSCKPSTYGLPSNPAADADRRREPARQPLDFYGVEEVEALARALADGRHRKPDDRPIGDHARALRAAEDAQDAEVVRIAAYTGLRRGEVLALRWADVDYDGTRLTLRRAVSDGQEVDGTKSGKVRAVPLTRHAAQALARLQSRRDFTSPNDYVAASAVGDRLDGSALRRRVVAARDAVGLRPLRLHDLRHTFGSLLAAEGVDVVAIKAAYGHSKIETTERYLHARSAGEQAARFTAALDASTTNADTARSDARVPLLAQLADLDAEELRALLSARRAS